MSTNRIIMRNGQGAPAAGDLEVAEVAVDTLTGDVYTKDENGNVVPVGTGGGSSLWEQNGNDIYYDAGDVGIGTDSPASKFHVKTSDTSGGNIAYFDDSGTNSTGRLQIMSTGGTGSDFMRIAAINRSIQLGTTATAHVTIKSNNGNVGIGMAPLARTAEEQLAEWRASFDARLKAEPKADKKAVTLEITDDAFEVLPTEEIVAEWMETRAAGDKLQVSGNISSSGTVHASYFHRPTKAGIGFVENIITPVDKNFTALTGQVDLGRPTQKFKDAHFSGTVNATEGSFSGAVRTGSTSTATTGAVVGDAVYSRNAVADNTASNEVWRGYGAGAITSRIKSNGNAVFSGTVNAAEGSFSGTVSAGQLTAWSAGVYRTSVSVANNGNGIYFNGEALVPANSTGAAEGSKFDIGTSGASTGKWKDAHFSGTVNAATINGKVTDVADHIKAITPTQIANWDAGTGGGGGGATTDGRISDTQITHWDTAYGWGNHATAGYQPAGNYLTSGSLNGYATESWVNSQGFAKGSFVPTSGNTNISGTLTATDFVATSDERLKQNTATAPLGLVDQLRGVEFEWKEDGRQDAGVIAQEVEKVLPHLVHDTGEHKAVNYNGLVAYLIEEVKALRAEVEALKS